MFEVYTDDIGNQKVRLKNGAKSIKIGNTTYELIIDPVTGQQTLKMVTKQEVGKETIEDIMRLAGILKDFITTFLIYLLIIL